MSDRVVDAASSDELAPVDAAIVVDAVPAAIDTANVVDAPAATVADDKIVGNPTPVVDAAAAKPDDKNVVVTAIIPARPPRRRRPPPSPTDPTGSLSAGSADASADPAESDRSAEKLSTAPESPPAVDIPPPTPPPAVDIPAAATDPELPYGVTRTTRLDRGDAALRAMISRRSLPRG
jgi:hypothetical protein